MERERWVRLKRDGHRATFAAFAAFAERPEPPMSLDKDTVRKIAFLARIRVPEDALANLAGELSNIIGWVEQLGEVDTDGVAPMTSVADMT